MQDVLQHCCLLLLLCIPWLTLKWDIEGLNEYILRRPLDLDEWSGSLEALTGYLRVIKQNIGVCLEFSGASQSGLTIGIIGSSLGLVLLNLVHNHSKIIVVVPKKYKPPNKQHTVYTWIQNKKCTRVIQERCCAVAWLFSVSSNSFFIFFIFFK